MKTKSMAQLRAGIRERIEAAERERVRMTAYLAAFKTIGRVASRTLWDQTNGGRGYVSLSNPGNDAFHHLMSQAYFLADAGVEVIEQWLDALKECDRRTKASERRHKHQRKGAGK
jgi:hypothetical protein